MNYNSNDAAQLRFISSLNVHANLIFLIKSHHILSLNLVAAV